MFNRRLTGKILGAAVSLLAVFLMIGTAGGVESGSVSVAAAFLRMGIGCLMILAGSVGILE